MIKLPMTMISSLRHTRAACLATLAAVSLFTGVTSLAQAPEARITSAINNASRARIPGSLSPRAVPANDIGAVPASTRLQGISIVLSRTPAQQAALDALVAAQQNPASPQYHQWLTPAQFGAQFGAAASDIAAIQNWLQQQGFAIDSVSNSRDRIFFTGTEGQVESAFGTQLHYFKSANGTHFTPATELSVPSAIASAVLTVTNLSDFKPHPQVKFRTGASGKPNFTSSQTGNNFLDPDDVATIYDINAAYNAGYTGTGQSIAIMGQSAIVATDITNFQTALGLPAKAPTQVLVPLTGVSAISAGDEAESDLDLEYSSTIARGATVYFVYTGNSTASNNDGVFTSMQYAIDNRIAPIISISYGDCETDLGTTNYSQLNALLQQGASQGQSIVSSAGDNGSTSCYGDTDLTLVQQEALSADFPSTSQYVTSMGGTEFSAANVAAGNTTYWIASTGTDVVSSAKSYIPEVVWNDDAVDAQNGSTTLSSGGGGVSVFTARPPWQTGVPGITAGSFRMVPDISLAASPDNPGFLFCSSDTTAWNTGQSGSCVNGFRDANDTDVTLAGGTSFDAPIFSGILALINQSRNSTGQGVVNPTLYTLASNPTTYASAFHDTTSGSNACEVASATFCSTAGESEYAATVGYDEASGLGSIDAFNLLSAWPSSSTSILLASTTTLSAGTTAPASGATDTVTITVGPVAATGTVTLIVDSITQSPITLTAGTATYSFSSTTVGSHVIVATYSGNVLYAPSTTTLVVSVGGTTATGGSVNLTAGNITVAQGASGNSTLTLTPAGGYTGTFVFETIDSPSTLINACASDPANITISGTSAGTSTITIYTNTTSCPAGSVSLMKGATGHFAHSAGTKIVAGNPASNPFKRVPLGPLPAGLASAGLLLVGILGRRSRKLRSIVAVCLLAVVGLAVSGCSNSTTSAPPPAIVDAPQGTYTLTLVGQDSVNPTVTASANFTLVIN